MATTNYAVILLDGEYSTLHVFHQIAWWEWLTADDMPDDGKSCWDVPAPTSLAAITGESMVKLTVGTYQNDKAQMLAVDEYWVPVPEPDEDEEWDNDEWEQSARTVLKGAAEHNVEIHDDHIYVGLWY